MAAATDFAAAVHEQATDEPAQWLKTLTLDGIVSVHNGLAEVVCQNDVTLKELSLEQLEVRRAIENMRKDMHASLKAAKEEEEVARNTLSGEVREESEKQKARFAELGSNIKDGLADQARVNNDCMDALKVKVTSITRSVEDLEAKLKEALVSTSRWKEDTAVDAQSLRNALSSQGQTQERKLDEQAARLGNLTVTVSENRSTAEVSLSRLAETIAGQIKAIQKDGSATADKLTGSEGRISREQSCLSLRLDGFGERLDQLVQPLTAALADNVNTAIGRVDTLELAFKQANFEHMAFHRSVTEDLSRLTTADGTMETSLESKLENNDAMQRAAIADLKSAVEAQLCAEVMKLSTSLLTTNSLTTTLDKQVADLQSFAKDVDVRTTSRFQGFGITVTKQIEEAIDAAKQRVQNDEGVRIVALESALERCDAEAKESAKSIREELVSARTHNASIHRVALDKTSELGQHMDARFEPIHGALKGLQELFKEFTLMHESHDQKMTELDQLVRAVEHRKWPWKAGARGRSRSNDPGAARVQGGCPSGQPPLACHCDDVQVEDDPSLSLDQTQPSQWAPCLPQSARTHAPRPGSARGVLPASCVTLRQVMQPSSTGAALIARSPCTPSGSAVAVARQGQGARLKYQQEM